MHGIWNITKEPYSVQAFIALLGDVHESSRNALIFS
jgi:hypothetical protein